MKEQNWEDSSENSREFIEVTTGLPAENLEAAAGKEPATSSKSQLTELRRRIEERLDSKRIALEYEYDDFDDLEDNFQ